MLLPLSEHPRHAVTAAVLNKAQSFTTDHCTISPQCKEATLVLAICPPPSMLVAATMSYVTFLWAARYEVKDNGADIYPNTTVRQTVSFAHGHEPFAIHCPNMNAVTDITSGMTTIVADILIVSDAFDELATVLTKASPYCGSQH